MTIGRFGVALLLLASSVAAQPEYVADLAAAREVWGVDPEIETVDDLFRLRIDAVGGGYVADTHLFDQPVRLIPYHDLDNVTDAEGRPIARGDAVLSHYFQPGDFGLAIRHTRSAGRRLDLTDRRDDLTREYGHRNTHVEILVGVQRDGIPGVITLNSPQTYEGGRFGNADYPMIFLRVGYPDSLPAERRRAYQDNVRTWAAAFDALLAFPVSYRRDQLSASSPAAVLEYATMAVHAIAGNDSARKWFQKPAQHLYCSELAYLSINAGVLAPLNRETFLPLVGEQVWTRFTQQMLAHNLGRDSLFTELNKNPYASLVPLALSPPGLQPLDIALEPTLAQPKLALEPKLALQPMTLPDVIETSILNTIPREKWGNEVAEAQALWLERTREPLLNAAGLGRELGDETTTRVMAIYDQIVEVISRKYESQAAFRRDLDPLVADMRNVLCNRDDSPLCFYAPPAIFNWVAQGLWPSHGVTIDYVGHGLHYSLVRRAD